MFGILGSRQACLTAGSIARHVRLRIGHARVDQGRQRISGGISYYEHGSDGMAHRYI
jgi:hypothetical protein